MPIVDGYVTREVDPGQPVQPTMAIPGAPWPPLQRLANLAPQRE